MGDQKNENYSEKEAKARFEAALKSALNTPHKPLKEKPKVAARGTKRPTKRAKIAGPSIDQDSDYLILS
jgi:hypothetical protein